MWTKIQKAFSEAAGQGYRGPRVCIMGIGAHDELRKEMGHDVDISVDDLEKFPELKRIKELLGCPVVRSYDVPDDQIKFY